MYGYGFPIINKENLPENSNNKNKQQEKQLMKNFLCFSHTTGNMLDIFADKRDIFEKINIKTFHNLTTRPLT